jgi:hypothetical protein
LRFSKSLPVGKDSCAVNQEHSSVKVISEHNYSENKLNLLTSIDISFLEKQIDKINVNKATGKDFENRKTDC